ncbi:UNVERIFIED_CONTAM: hypothetical protein Slati_0167400 [Sesamum latifolium]|uniref:Reverse transcriptase zinc-binding domain-containing protein n=1 Tax=Sesamum latifolium TaxID=2727402 RepID=A0AAW2YAM3_9LAMI
MDRLVDSRLLSFQVISAPNTLQPNVVVAELLDEEGEWKEALVRKVFQPEYVDAILGITLNAASQDQLRWQYERYGQYERNGQYTVKSAYRLLTQRSECLWRACRDSLPTAVNLARRGVNVGGACPRCGSEEEDVLHSLLRCHFARLVWALSDLPWAYISCDHSNPEAWFRGMYYDLDAHAFARALLLRWFLWGSWNTLLFENCSLSTPATMEQVRSWERALRINNSVELTQPFKASDGSHFIPTGIG